MLGRYRRSPVAALCAALSVVLLAWAPAGAAHLTRVDVKAASYAPSGVDLGAVGRRVRWTNVTSPSRVHDVVSSLPDYFTMPLGGNGATYRFTFTSAGYFTYYCSIHDTMLGAVSVPLTGEPVDDPSGTRIRLELSSVRWPKGSRYVSAVFVQGRTDPAPRFWKTTHAAAVEYLPAAPGEYRFTARVKDRVSRRSSGDSAPLIVSVGSPPSR
jgi:plastocyanin